MNYGERLSGNPGNDRYMQFLPTTEWEKGESSIPSKYSMLIEMLYFRGEGVRGG